MTTILLGVSDPLLRAACRRQLSTAGHAAVEVERPLSLLGLADRLRWDAMCVDDSVFGRQCLDVARQAPCDAPVIALGFVAPGVFCSLAMPLSREGLLGSVERLTARAAAVAKPSLRLDPGGRRALAGEAEVRLSGTEYRLLALLAERGPAGVSVEEALSQVWGQEPGALDAGVLRVHVRNLRAKLAGAGLPNAVQSRRGRGYVLEV